MRLWPFARQSQRLTLYEQQHLELLIAQNQLLRVIAQRLGATTLPGVQTRVETGVTSTKRYYYPPPPPQGSSVRSPQTPQPPSPPRIRTAEDITVQTRELIFQQQQQEQQRQQPYRHPQAEQPLTAEPLPLVPSALDPQPSAPLPPDVD